MSDVPVATEPTPPQTTPIGSPAHLRKYRLSILKNPNSQTVETVEIVGAGISFWSDNGPCAMLVIGDDTGNAVYTVPLNRVYSLVDPDYELGGPSGDPILPFPANRKKE